MTLLRNDYYELLFNFSNLKEENSQLKKQSDISNTTNNTSNFKSLHRPQTSRIKEVDSIFRKSLYDLKSFRENPLFDEEDLINKYETGLDNDINNKKSNEETEFSDDELNDLINKSISDINFVKEIKEVNEVKENIIENKKLPPVKIKSGSMKRLNSIKKV